MMKLNRLLFVTFCTCLLNLGFSQYEFNGLVQDNGNALVGATIHVVDTEVTVVTDLEGTFTFEYSEPVAMVNISYLGTSLSETLYSNQFNEINLSVNAVEIQPVFVSEKYPITQTTVSSQQIESQNLGQDIPILLEQLPSVVSTSDAGAGVGYSGIRVRGSDATRVNVTINGIPLNDSESQGVFWVNMPDFASSTANMTLVRGVGTSTNGAGAFGASLHLQTEDTSDKAYAEYNGSVGSFNTWKHNVKLNTGEKNGWSANARLSTITSDGYVDRASSDLQSYFLQAEKTYGDDVSQGGSLKFVTFKGHEKTYQAWYGVEESILETDRTYNPYTYENQVDNYQQEHYQLLWNQNMSRSFGLNVGLHYTKGKGYFEEFKEDDDFSGYGLSPITIGGEVITSTDLVRRRWLDNDFYGIVAHGTYTNQQHELVIGGGWNTYLGDHFGEVIQGQYVPQEAIGENYYENDATKRDGTIYAKYIFDKDLANGNAIRPFIDLQFRAVNYEFVGLALDGNSNIQELPQTVNHQFFNPKVGITADFGEHQAYASFARAQKEPNRNDYTDSPSSQLPLAEKLNDFELGFRFTGEGVHGAINGYYMDYKDQLAITGGVNDVGEYSRVNVPDSYRAGIELEGSAALANSPFSVQLNATFSQNKVDAFTEHIDDYDNGGLQTIEHTDTDLALSPNVIAGGSLIFSPNQVIEARLIGKYVGKQFLDNTSTDERSIDAYFVNHFNATLQLGQFIPQLQKVQMHVLVNNLWDKTYESNGYTFGYIYGGERIYEEYYYPQAGTNFLTGLSIRF